GDDLDGAAGPGLTSTEILAAEAVEEMAEDEGAAAGIVSLDTVEQAAITEELAAVEAAMDGAVEAVEGAEAGGVARAGDSVAGTAEPFAPEDDRRD
ncbi:MAG: hypothetical protein MUC54_08540, partial [Chloroflexi bacterium]|nr:hypothetical protein [Chloroflexota bacterium]